MPPTLRSAQEEWNRPWSADRLGVPTAGPLIEEILPEEELSQAAASDPTPTTPAEAPASSQAASFETLATTEAARTAEPGPQLELAMETYLVNKDNVDELVKKVQYALEQNPEATLRLSVSHIPQLPIPRPETTPAPPCRPQTQPPWASMKVH